MSIYSAIRLESIYKRYPRATKDILSGVNLEIPEGIIFGLLGPNGAGKTTLISIMCGIFSPSAGQVHFQLGGTPVSEKQKRMLIGYIPQDFAFYPELSLRQNMEYFGAMYQLTSLQINDKITELLPVLGLAQVVDDKVGTFSGGMKRRVNLVLGIMHNPSFLFLDEPTVGVDVQSKNAIICFLEELNQRGTTIIYTSHHLAEAQDFCTQIALIDHGTLIESGKTNELLAKHGQRDLQAMFIELTGTAFRD